MGSLAARHQPARCETGRGGDGNVGPWPLRNSLAEIRQEVTSTAIACPVKFVPLGMARGRGSFARRITFSLLFGISLRLGL